MGNRKASAAETLPITRLQRIEGLTIADQVFDLVQAKILSLEIPPLTKLSETEVASGLGVSRQPVREAFKRLAKLEFLVIRPQSGTTVSLISEAAALRALYVRTALEEKTCISACENMTEDGRLALAALVDQQRQAIDAQDREGFHALDDAFHKEICEQAGVGFVWGLIHEIKPHMDRVRMISLNARSQEKALLEHRAILKALCESDADVAVRAMQDHLARLLTHIETVKAENHNWFQEYRV